MNELIYIYVMKTKLTNTWDYLIIYLIRIWMKDISAIDIHIER